MVVVAGDRHRCDDGQVRSMAVAGLFVLRMKRQCPGLTLSLRSACYPMPSTGAGRSKLLIQPSISIGKVIGGVRGPILWEDKNLLLEF